MRPEQCALSLSKGCKRETSIHRFGRPVVLAWAQECEHIEDAFVLEHKIKGWRRDKKLALIEGRLKDLPALSHS